LQDPQVLPVYQEHKELKASLALLEPEVAVVS
jgi:hypothetical protein